jgi:AraC family transcriptional regulator
MYMEHREAAHTQLQITSKGVQLQPGLIVNLTCANPDNTSVTRTSYQHTSEYIHFNCLLQGTFQAKVRNHEISLSPGDLNVGYANGEHFDVAHCSDLSNIELLVDPKLLLSLAGEDCHLITPTTVGRFFTHSCPASNRARFAAAQLCYHLSSPDYPQLLIHSAALDYLYWHLNAFKGDADEEPVAQFERRRLMQAREFLLQDLSAPPTIAEIALKVGLNQFKLKQGFKKLFNSSIYAYFQGERMKKAQTLLQRHNVTETAMILGYSNVSHFSSAFRKQFGVLPGSLRQDPDSLLFCAPAPR